MADDHNDYNRQLIEEFRANDGKVSGWGDAPLLLLTTTGAKSGREHTTPVAYTRDGDRIIVIASYAGAPKHPAWYHNLVANPEATVELGTEALKVRAAPTEGDERDRLYRAQAELLPSFNEYEQKTTRKIPVLALTPAS
jgi:deazaflavin-dependent oxidoreductase (nitroreductase family)